MGKKLFQFFDLSIPDFMHFRCVNVVFVQLLDLLEIAVSSKPS